MKNARNRQATASELFQLDEESIRKWHQDQQIVNEALRQEVSFILNERISSSSIKIHTIESRVKDINSVLKKCLRKTTNTPSNDIDDIVGARVICLFRSDIDNLSKIIGENFEILKIDDKFGEGNDPLKYLSVHITCIMKSGFKGPRYEKIHGVQFEIQLRTLCMHCWAAVSHYVDYKGDWDVPANLKMALNALSGLFYVADSEFEQFNAAMTASREAAVDGSKSKSEAREINLDTVTALLRTRFPQRMAADKSIVSELVHEIKLAGYGNIDDLSKDMIAGEKSVEDYESKHKDGDIFFIDVGAARHGLESASRDFANVRREINQKKKRGGMFFDKDE